MYRIARPAGSTRSATSRLGCAGLAGETEFSWQREKGITSFFMHDVRELGISTVVDRTLRAVGEGPVFLTVDVDVLDPAFAPGTGTPEPGGMTPGELLPSVRRIAESLELVGVDVVEVIPRARARRTSRPCCDRIVRRPDRVALRKRMRRTDAPAKAARSFLSRRLVGPWSRRTAGPRGRRPRW